MQIEVTLGNTFIEIEEGHLEAIAERIPKGELTYESIRENADQLAETVVDRINFVDEDSVGEIADQVVWDHSRIDDISSRVDELEREPDSYESWWNNNKHTEVEALLEEYKPGNGCSAGDALTSALQRGLEYINENKDVDEAPSGELAPAGTWARVLLLEEKVDELQEVLAVALKAVSFGGRVAGSQLGTAMFEAATKRATENSRNAYDNDVADEKRRLDVSALFAALEGEL